MNTLDFEDRLEPLGIALGAFLVLVGLGTLVGMPWTLGISAGAVILQLVGIVALLGLGVGLAWLSWVGE